MRFRWKSYDPKQLIWPLDAFAALPIPPAPLLNLFMPNKEHDASSGATVLLSAFIVCFSEPGAVSESSAHRTSAAAFFQFLGKRRFSCCCTHHLDQIWAKRSSVENCLLEEETERCCCWGFLHFLLLFGLKEMIVGVPGSGPWVMLPDGNLLLPPLGDDGSHFSPHGLLLCLLCAQWTGLVTLRGRHHVGGSVSFD